jgi:ornithine carbamoyltransferase
MNAPPRTSSDLLRIGDLTAVELDDALALAAAMKAEPMGWRDAREGRSLACFLDDPAVRRHVVVATAARRLGLLPVMLTRREVERLRADPTGDIARVLSAYAEGLVVATLTQRALRELARVSPAPVVNAVSDEEDPLQALADLLTLRTRFGTLAGLAVAYVGAGELPVVHSLMEAGARTGLDLRIACPPEHRPLGEIAAATEALAEAHGGRIRIVADPREAVEGARVVYTAAWPAPLDRSYRVDTALVRDALLMHPLPACRGAEVTRAALDGPRSLVGEQAANALPATQAAIFSVLP